MDNTPFLIFAGAGVSMLPPSSLPDWKTFNDAVIEALADRLSNYTRRSLGGAARESVTQKRDASSTFAPDYMADIIAEQCGVDYFRVLQALDTEDYNACHAIVADLAAAGRCAAVITTNFDRLFERAFESRGVAHQAFYDPPGFERLAASIGDGSGGAPTPIIKVHGSAEAPESMVDTLSQRVAGRPESLDRALSDLYARFPVVMVGFSGADLDYDPNYLALRSAAETNQGLTYLAFSAANVRNSIHDLASAWGRLDAVMEGRLPEWLAGWAESEGVPAGPRPESGEAVDRKPLLQKHAADWAASLGDMQAVNILNALLRAAGDDEKAGYLFYSFWRHYRSQKDTLDPSYSRFNHQLGRYLLEYGWTMESLRPKYISTRVVTSGDPGRAAKWAVGALDNGLEFLARALRAKNGAAAADLAVCHAFMGDAQRAIDLIGGVLNSALETHYPPVVLDTVIAGGTIWSLAAVWTNGLARLEAAERLARRVGLEHRRAALLAHLVRFLAWKERPGDARNAYEEGRTIAQKLGLEREALQLESAWGYALYEADRYQEAVDVLLPACAALEKSKRLADLTQAGLDLADASRCLWEQAPIDRAFRILEEHEIGYQPHVHIAYAMFYLKNKDYESSQASAQAALAAAKDTRNDGALQRAESILQILAGKG